MNEQELKEFIAFCNAIIAPTLRDSGYREGFGYHHTYKVWDTQIFFKQTKFEKVIEWRYDMHMYV